jgi:hypothetical protein
MGQLVFQATLGGQVNLVGPNTASTFNLNVPAVSSTLATLTGTETFTNKTLTSPTLTTPVLGTPSSGTLTNCTGLPNAGLVNSSVTVGSTSIALGATATTVAGLTSLASNTLTSAAATNLTIQSAGTTAITIDTSQNVGIGTTTPSSFIYSGLAVGNGTTNNSISIYSSSASESLLAYAVGTTGTDRYKGYVSYSHGGSFMAFGTASTERMRLNTSGTVILQGGSTSATGVGITFPATQSASSDANTLDDYEEGTWTPTMQGSITNPTVTYVTQTGSYTKVGNMVTLFGRLQTGGALIGGSGTALIGGLPFAVSSTYRNGGAIGYISNVTLSSGNTQFGLSSDVSTSTIRFVQSGSANGANVILIGGINAGLDVVFTYTYSV